MSTRDQILEIAYRAFAEKGYNHTSMGAIAEELGITRPALYYHFSSKEDLLLATYEMIDPLINVSADEALGCTEPAEFKQAFAALIASITSNLRNDEQRARFVATVESTSGQDSGHHLRAPRPVRRDLRHIRNCAGAWKGNRRRFGRYGHRCGQAVLGHLHLRHRRHHAPRLQDQHESHP